MNYYRLVNPCLLLLILFFLPFTDALAESKILNVYSWSIYLSDEVIHQFEKETGIHINYATYDNNDTLYAKLKANPKATYDVVFPSSYFVDRMQRQHMLAKLDKQQLPNFKYIKKNLLNKPFDPQNNYSIPYFWGSTAIVVNKRYHDVKQVSSWEDLWKQQFKNQLLILDDIHDIFAMALITLGYSASDTNPEHIYQAYLKLKALLPNVKLFNTDAARATYIDEDATIGMGYNGDTFQAQQENSDLVYVYPSEGFILWIDCMVIPKNAPHIKNAYRFINFLMRPDIAAKLSEKLGFPTPNEAAMKLLPKSLRENRTVYPSDAILSRGQLEADTGNASTLYEKYMELLKISA